MNARHLAAHALALTVLVAPVALRAVQTLEGKVILTRVAPDALIVWDATDRVVTLEGEKKPADEILRVLEGESSTAAASMLASFPKAKSVTVRIIYQRTGAVSPAYGNASLLGVERLVSLVYPVEGLATKSASYDATLAKGATPAGVKVDVTGKLPT